jgi:DNA-binding NarL/FixJ family response regulator
MPGAGGGARMDTPMQTVLVVDDHASFRSLARRLLAAEGFDVVGEAEDGASAVSAALELRPAVILLDVQLPDIDGFEVARRVTDAGVGTSIVLVSTRDSASYRRRLADSPAAGFIPKAELSGRSLAELVS